MKLVGGPQESRLVRAPAVGVRALEDAIDRRAVDAAVERDPHVLAPFVRGFAEEGRAQDEQLAVAPGEPARRQQKAAER
jgi:hypothetical protein